MNGALGAFGAWLCAVSLAAAAAPAFLMEKQLTFAPCNHDLDHGDNFSRDDRWLVFDTRAEDTAITGNAVIARVNVATGEVAEIHCEPHPQPWGPGVGAPCVDAATGRIAFLRGLDSASAARPYAMWRRTGVAVDPAAAGRLQFLDARDVIASFTPGALRGSTHRHEWSADGQWIGFTYNDALLAEREERTGEEVNLRTVGVATKIERGPVRVPAGPENNDGEMFAAVVVCVVPSPRPGSDEISRAFEDAWVGREGYRRADGTRQRRARAFLGNVRGPDGREFTEVFIVDIPKRIDVRGAAGPLEGTPTTMPNPPHGAVQRRLTFTADRKFPGAVLAPRHWVRSSADGTRIVFLAQDDAGVVQAFLVAPEGGAIRQVTRHATSIQSCVRWSPDGAHLLYVCGGAITICDARQDAVTFGRTRVLTTPAAAVPESPVWSHDGRMIAFNRRVPAGQGAWKQISLTHP